MCRPYLESPAVPYSRCSRAHVAVAAYPALALVLNLILIFVVLFRFLFSLFTQLFVFFLRIKADKYDVAAWESLIVETSKVCHLCESHLFSVSVFKYYSSIYILLQKTQGHPLTSHNSSRLFFYLPSRHKRTLAPVEHCARPRVLQTVLGSVSDGVCALEGVRYYEY